VLSRHDVVTKASGPAAGSASAFGSLNLDATKGRDGARGHGDTGRTLEARRLRGSVDQRDPALKGGSIGKPDS
jgi:hypothetical protein